MGKSKEEGYKLWKVEYTFFKEMWGECITERNIYFVAARDTVEATDKADDCFACISPVHRTFVNAGGVELKSPDYGILSNLQKSAQPYEVQEIFYPTFGGLDKNKFDLEALLIDGGKAVKYVVKPK